MYQFDLPIGVPLHHLTWEQEYQCSTFRSYVLYSSDNFRCCNAGLLLLGKLPDACD